MSSNAHSENGPVWAETVVFAIENVYADTDNALLLFAWPVITLAGFVSGGLWLWLVIGLHAALWFGSYRAVLAERYERVELDGAAS